MIGGLAFLQFLSEKFASFGPWAWREISVIWGVEDELRKLQRTFLRVRDLVDCMEGTPLRFLAGSDAWQIWFEDMRKLAYDVDALLDHVSLNLSRYCAENSVITSSQETQVRKMVLSSELKKLVLPHKISNMQLKLDDLAKEMESLAMIEKAKFDASLAKSSESSNFYSSGSSFVDDKTMVGRVEDKERIVDLLSKECERSNFSVIPIVGMGGIGKTALAQLVYNDNNVWKSFEKRIWVSISMDFDAVRITKSMIEYATHDGCNVSDLNTLQVILQDILRGRKFLLVLDDYWSEKYDDWDTLCSSFRFGTEGSKVIVTTRSTKVASIVSSSEPYKLRILSNDDCWELIIRRAFMSMETSQNLEPIGKQLAEKCKGLPLVAMILGSMLRCKSTEEEWHGILENELWDMPQDQNIFLHLMKSYLYLPAHLQKCFSYCSIFPQNHEFEVEELILLWMAEGFIQPIGARRLEDIGIDYFNDLYSRSLFQQCESTPNMKRYKMHDLIHDMAQLVSRDICIRGRYDMLNRYPLFGDTCHLSLYHENMNQPLELKASLKNKRLRTFLVMNKGGISKLDPQLFSKLQSLRVLGLSGAGLLQLPEEFDELKYLRYLNLSENLFSSLPKSICKLVALEVLMLRDCSQLCELPEDMQNLSNLRHLDLDINSQFKLMPPEFGRLTNLHSLSAFIVSSKNGHGIEELENLNCLRGSLCIRNIERVSSAQVAEKAKLNKKTGLKKLELKWEEFPYRPGSALHYYKRDEQAQVLANLQPHENLKELVIRNYCGTVCPNWLSESSGQLTSIHLQGLEYCNSLPCLGELRFLKSFIISNMPCLGHVDNNFYGSSNTVKFPSLESFVLRDMSGLEKWINVSDTAMPCLNRFTIDNCPNLEKLPPKLQSFSPSSKNISNCPKL